MANEEKRNAKEIKETNKKINEASKQKKYGDMNVEEAKKEDKTNQKPNIYITPENSEGELRNGVKINIWKSWNRKKRKML